MLPNGTALAETGRVPVGARLVNLVEEFYDIPSGSVKNPERRNGNISKARWALSFVLNKDVGWNESRIAKFLGQDHKAVAYGRRQTSNLMRTCPIFFEAVRLLREEVAPNGDSTV